MPFCRQNLQIMWFSPRSIMYFNIKTTPMNLTYELPESIGVNKRSNRDRDMLYTLT